MLEKALSFGGWPGLILLISGNLFGICAWLLFFIHQKYKETLFCTVLLFPFMFYAGQALGIVSYSTDDSVGTFHQRIGLTSLLITLLGVVLLMRGRLKRPNNRSGRIIELLMWCFSISVTVSQLVTHEVLSAILLSFGATWQFLIFFYLLISLLKNEQDILQLLKAVFAMSLLNILVRVVAKGEPWILDPRSVQAGIHGTFGSEAGRVGSGALGLAASYSGYLAILITLAFGVLLLTKKKKYVVYIAIAGVELLNTFTRGGILIVSFLGLLILFKSTRGSVLKVMFLSFFAALPLSGIVWSYLTARGFSLNFSEIANVTDRIKLYSIFFDNYAFPFWGNGILNRTVFQLSAWRSAVVENAYVDVLESGGVLALFFFALISVYSVYVLIRLSRKQERITVWGKASLSLAPYFLVALIQWVVFANTTSTSVMAYFPYEGMAIFWMVCFSAAVFMNMRHTTVPFQITVARQSTVNYEAKR